MNKILNIIINSRKNLEILNKIAILYILKDNFEIINIIQNYLMENEIKKDDLIDKNLELKIKKHIESNFYNYCEVIHIFIMVGVIIYIVLQVKNSGNSGNW